MDNAGTDRFDILNGYLEDYANGIWNRFNDGEVRVRRIGDIASDIITGKTPSTKNDAYYGEGYPFVTIPDMHSGIWLCSTARSLTELGNDSQPKKLVPRGSVLVSCIATIGLVGIASTASHFNQQINAVLPSNKGEEYYLYYAIQSIRRKLVAIGSTGSATPNVNKKAFSNIEIPWLDAARMEEYVKAVRPIFNLIESASNESIHLGNVRDTLLLRLISGEIDVSKVDITR